MKNYKRTAKIFGKGLTATAITVAGVTMLFAFPNTALLGLVTTPQGAISWYKSVQGNYIENSIMNLERNKFIGKLKNTPANYIAQGLPSAKQFLEATLSNDKMEFLKLQELNALLQLDKQDGNGNDIRYNVCTHSGNYMLLKQLQKQDIIQNMSKTQAGKSDLKLEKLLISNIKSTEYKEKRKKQIKENILAQKGIVNKIKTLREEMKIGIDKKTQMYDISFEKTDRELTIQDIVKFIPSIEKNSVIDEEKFKLIKDKNGKIKGIDYSTKYILGMLKQKAHSRYSDIKQKTSQKANEFSKTLRNLTISKEEVATLKQEENIVENTVEKVHTDYERG